MSPMPPIWMISSNTINPNVEKTSPTTMVVNPVTLTALAAVNKASMKRKDTPSYKLIGNDKRKEPMRIANK